MRRRIVTAALILSVVAAAFLWGYARYTGGKAKDRITTTGVVEATEVELSSKLSGRIEWLCCKEGQAVKAGDEAVRIESEELKARADEARAALLGSEQAVNEARAALENAAAQQESAHYELEAAASEVERVRALATEAEENLERGRSLFREGYMAKKDLDAAQASYSASQAQVGAAQARRRSAQANLKNASVNIKSARARISLAEARTLQAKAQVRVLEANLKDTVINSPIDGVVAYKAFEAGETVSLGQPIYTVNDLEDIWVRVDIEETDIRNVKLGSRAEAHLPVDGERAFAGRVIEIGEVGAFATQRDVTRGRFDIKTFRVKAAIDNPEGVLKPGMTVELNIFFNELSK